MLLYDLGKVSWLDSQVIYHTFPRMDREGLIICQPDSSYVCIGFHQDLLEEVDIDYCRQNNIPLFRREVGGGTVYLDQNQIFFQLVLHKDNPVVPLDHAKFYRKFLQPVIRALNGLNIQGSFRPHCDIVVNNRKISGNGAGEIEKYLVLVGNLLLDFDFETMAQVLKVPNKNFRRLLFKQMQRNMTTINKELKQAADPQLVKDLLIQAFSEFFGQLESASLDEDCLSRAEKLKSKYMSWEWLTEPGKKFPFRQVKIRESVYARAGQVMLQGVPVNVNVVLNNNVIEHLELTGTAPLHDRLIILEKMLVGKNADQVILRPELCKFLQKTKLSLRETELANLIKILT
ncbi:MAG: lipoate--protein ligase family protein [Thermoanaerobacteraceae bacterium]|nr:lipoate--protein ligase family protein [Thermoanaerobacteraceae bacterium]